ncbi:MAG: sigma-54-dependent Fis family transcriptional regulator, partial [Deltaproteobacteria bacterium]
QEKQITPLGSSRSKQLSFRVICATNRDLEHLCERGEFRHDLLARLNVFVVRVPPLRERLCDIDRLVDHFMSLHHGGSAAVVTQQARRRLRAYSWPGNVRELSNTAQYLLAMSDGGAIDVCHLPLKIAASPGAAVLGEGARGSFAARLRAFESALLRGEYDACAGNVSRMARRLQMDRSSLHQKLIDLEIHSARRPVPRGADA